MSRIAYIGNFGPPRSTENALAYGLRRHGVQVDEYPQDRMPREPPMLWARKIARQGVDAVIYTRTHNTTALDRGWTRAWRYLEDHGVGTGSYHLDVFVGMRRHGMGQPGKWIDPLFTTGMVMTPDPALAEQITTVDTRHVWAPPAADIRDHDPDDTPLEALAGKVIFVGSLYGTPRAHPEYPFRAQLIRWLQATYPDRFVWYGPGTQLGPVRGPDLWNIYASNAVIIGDSCFAATGERPYYWSDRIPETLAHRGVLIHPDVDGLAEQHPDLSTVPFVPLEDGRLAGEVDAALDLIGGAHHLAGYRAEVQKDTLGRHLYLHRAHQLIAELDLTPEEDRCSCPAVAPALPTG